MTSGNPAAPFSFSGTTWLRLVAGDPRIPAGDALAVALFIGAKAVRWNAWEGQVPVQTISQRLKVTPKYAADVVEYLVRLGYLTDSGRDRRSRQIYFPSLAPQFRDLYPAPPTNESHSDDHTATATAA